MNPEHPDANLLAALAEKKLAAHERGDVLAHLADCAECRSVVALASASAPAPERPRSPVWRWAAAAAAAILPLAAGWGLRLLWWPPRVSTPVPAVTLGDKMPPPASLPRPEIAVEPQIAPAPKAKSRPVLRKPVRPAPIPKEQELPRQFVAPQAAFARAAGPAQFHAIASQGSEVWAGGSHGAVFHSTDGGLRWTKVAVGAAGETLNGTIVAIRLPDASEVILETDSGQQWISHDGGLSWKRL